MALFQIGATSRFICFMVHFSDHASKSATRAVTARHRGKRMMGADQRKPDKRKLLDRNSKKLTVGYSYFVALPPRNSLLCGLSKHFGWQNSGNEKTWVPPSHPADYFSTFEMNTESKEPVRKKQGKGNWPVGWFHGKMAHTRGYKGEISGWWLKLPEKHSNEPAVIRYWLLVPFFFWRYYYVTNQPAISASHFTNIQNCSQMTCGCSFSELTYDDSDRRITCEIRG